jgi:hypothetical protein
LTRERVLVPTRARVARMVERRGVIMAAARWACSSSSSSSSWEEWETRRFGEY